VGIFVESWWAAGGGAQVGILESAGRLSGCGSPYGSPPMEAECTKMRALTSSLAAASIHTMEPRKVSNTHTPAMGAMGGAMVNGAVERGVTEVQWRVWARVPSHMHACAHAGVCVNCPG